MKSEKAHRLELMIGTLLRVGVSLAAAVVAIGAGVHLSVAATKTPSYHVFNGEPPGLTTFPGVIHGVAAHDGRAIMQFGLLLLIATPIARVLFSLVAFLHEKDWLYSVFTFIVLSALGYSLLAR